MSLIKSVKKLFKQTSSQVPSFNSGLSSAGESLSARVAADPPSSQTAPPAAAPVCTVYTKTLGPNFPVEVCDLNPMGVVILSHHDIFQLGEHVLLNMTFDTMKVSMPGRVIEIDTQSSEAVYRFRVLFRTS